MRKREIRLAVPLAGFFLTACVASAEWRAPTNTTGFALKSYTGLVADCGQDYLRQIDGRPLQGSIFTIGPSVLNRDAQGLWDFSGRLQTNLTSDVDGDSLTDDDVVYYLPFSATNRLNPELPWFDRRGASACWYGGYAIAQGDRRTPPPIQENGINDETVIPKLAPRDNWTLFHETYDVNGPYRFHAVWLWNQDGFLAGGDTGRVWFDTNSTIAVYCQRYWMGFEGIRWLVKEGGQYYLSEGTSVGAGQAAYGTSGKQHVFYPSQSRWAAYNPSAPHNLYWPVNTNSFATRTFTNVQAVGWYLYKDRFVPSFTGFKWYAFETKARVERRDLPSLAMDMIETGSAGALPAFYMSSCEVPYLLWKDVFRRARSNTFVLERGSTFDRDGDMGSMDLDDATHRLEEPVTDVTVPDVLAWCNVLSREEGFAPVYYTDAGLTNVFREVLTPPHLPPATNLTVYVKWAADGYRLPTSDEWTLAAGGTPVTNGLPVYSNTVLVDADSPDANGFYHIHDNVSELVWVWGDCYNSATSGSAVVLGGDFRRGGTADAGASGFRLFRRAANLSAPTIRTNSSFTLKPVGETTAPPVAAPPAIVMVDIPGGDNLIADREVSFVLWRDVRNWARTNGYQFDRDGDLGSMDWWGFADIEPVDSHTLTEPVTDITAYDAMIWCNALSEREGRTPAYYTSVAYTQVCRTAFRFRNLMQLDFEMGSSTNLYYQPVYRMSGAGGYSLLNRADFTNAAVVSRTQFGGFTSAAQISNRVWVLETAGGTTRPVGTSEVATNGFYDLTGNVMELGTGENTASMQDCFGSSFLDPAKLLTYTTTIKAVPRGWGYPDLGFRVMRPKP